MSKFSDSLFYYDFRLGAPGTSKKHWIERNIKLVAANPIHALYLYALLMKGTKNPDSYAFKSIQFEIKPTRAGSTNPIIYLHQFNVRRIVEYKVTSNNGRTQVRYKRLAVYFITNQFRIKETDF